MVYVKIFIYVTLQFPISNKLYSGGYKKADFALFIFKWI